MWCTSPVPILDFWGPYAKLCCRRRGVGGLMDERMDETRNSISSAAYAFNVFFFFVSSLCQETDFYVERVTVHRIKINDHSCFHNRLPSSKTKLNLKHLWEQGGPLVFRGPYAACVFCVYREDRLCTSHPSLFTHTDSFRNKTLHNSSVQSFLMPK